MEPATLLFEDVGDKVLERVTGYLLTPRSEASWCLWQPSASCQLERADLARLFEGLETMRECGEAVLIDTDMGRTHYHILEVDPTPKRLRLTEVKRES